MHDLVSLPHRYAVRSHIFRKFGLRINELCGKYLGTLLDQLILIVIAAVDNTLAEHLPIPIVVLEFVH